MITICIGAHPDGRDQRGVAVALHSIRTNTPADIEFIVGGNWTGGTGFSSWRYNLPKTEGYAIYVDSDVLVFGDIAELMEYKEEGLFVGAPSKLKLANVITEGTMPGVIDCTVEYPDDLRLTKAAGLYVNKIPSNWNSCDHICGDTKLLHFSRRSLQPWRPYSPQDREIDRIWLDYERKMLQGEM